MDRKRISKVQLPVRSAFMTAEQPSRQHRARISRWFLGRAGLTALLWLLILSAVSANGVIPTYTWVDIYSLNSSLNGDMVPVGATIAAFDPSGVQCGEFTVHTEGEFGLMPCYGDDGATPLDEGASPADELHFTINGWPAVTSAVSLNAAPVALGTPVIWNQHSDLWQVDLAAPPPGCSRYDLNCDGRINTVDIMGVASRWGSACGDESYQVRFDLDGDCDIDIVDIMAIAGRWQCEFGDACYV